MHPGASQNSAPERGRGFKKLFFIEKGCIRVWFNGDGKDITFQFFFENDLVSSTESFKKNVPSIVTIETVEPCVLWVAHKKLMDRIMKECLEVRYAGRVKLLESIPVKLKRRLKMS